LIFNSHFTGSPTWDLFSAEAVQLKNSWNVSLRRTFDLPYQIHRYLVEPVSDHIHNCIQSDTRSITGSNIRKILLLIGKGYIHQVGYRDIENIEYARRVDVIKELTDVKFGQLIVDGFSLEECEEILQYACIS
jgi:hypothetical protein